MFDELRLIKNGDHNVLHETTDFKRTYGRPEAIITEVPADAGQQCITTYRT